jgi:antibiotic biosynthesis monooxygenase (ABM) superfamily enzyme
MPGPVHIAITRRIRKECVGSFEKALAEFARASLAAPGAQGVLFLRPPPGSDSNEYGILRTFESEASRDAFYASPLYHKWVEQVSPWVEGKYERRQLTGLEAWFHEPGLPMPPDWKMAVLTWIAVWPVSMLVPAICVPLLGPKFNQVLAAGIIALGIVIILTWVAMPILVKVTYRWLYPTVS